MNVIFTTVTTPTEVTPSQRNLRLYKAMLYVVLIIIVPLVGAVLVQIFEFDRMDVFIWMGPLLILGAFIDHFCLSNRS